MAALHAPALNAGVHDYISLIFITLIFVYLEQIYYSLFGGPGDAHFDEQLS